MSYSRFGDLLRTYRKAAGMTQEQLTELSGVSVRGISDLERGINRFPWIDTTQKLANALNLTSIQREKLFAARQRTTPLERRTPVVDVRSSAARSGSLALIGRAREQKLIYRLLNRDGPPLLLFYGEPGIGKSRLLQDADDQARQLGWIILRGGSQQAFGQHPYAPLVQALESSLAKQTLDQRRQSLDGCEWMARLLPELTVDAVTPVSTWQTSPEQERRLMFGAVERYLTRLAEPSGVLLILDDMQWATPDALSLLATIIRSTANPARQVKLRVVAAARDIQLDTHHPLFHCVADLARDGLVARTQLEPLAMEHASKLLHAALADLHGIAPGEGGTAIRLALTRAGGVPFYLMGFARTLSERRRESDQMLAATDIPWDIAHMIRQRLDALSPASQEVLTLAAAHGRETPLTLLASACDLTERQFIEAIEAIYVSNLLVEEGSDSCKFQHDLIREVVLADLSAVRVEMLHRRVAEAMEADPRHAQAAPLAFHLERGAQMERSIVYLERSGDQAFALRAHSAAEGCYRDALVQLKELGYVGACARVREKLGSLLMACGSYADAADALEEAASCFYKVDDRDGMGRVVAQIGWAHIRGGTGDQGLARVESLLMPVALTSLRLSTQAALWCAHAVLLFGQNRYLEQLASAQRAATLARAANDTAALAQSMRLEGLALVQLGHLDEALPVLHETINISKIVGDLDSYSAALNDAAAVYRARGEITASWNYSALAVEVVEDLVDPTAEAFFESSHGDNAYLLGDWGTARDSFERAVRMVRAMGSSWVVAYPFISLGALNLAEGRNVDATSYLEEGLALAAQSNDLQALRIVQSMLAERELLHGAAGDALLRLQPLLDSSSADEKDSLALLPFVGWAYVELGRLNNADAVLSQCLRRADAKNNRLVSVDALIAQARLRIRQEAWADARVSLDNALALSHDMRHCYAEVKARYVFGNLYVAKREFAQARKEYDKALEHCHDLGEAHYRSHIEYALSRLPEV